LTQPVCGCSVKPGQPGSIVSVDPRYENFIGGKWLTPTRGKYRVDLSPANGAPITKVAESSPEDIELALDAARAAKDAWGGEASATERAEVLNAVADTIENDKEMLAVAESWENGKACPETTLIPSAFPRLRHPGPERRGLSSNFNRYSRANGDQCEK
jgi:aldehyde dehydrogenase